MGETPKDQAIRTARRLRGPCNYVYRWERDETARLLTLFAQTLDNVQRVVDSEQEAKAQIQQIQSIVQETKNELQLARQEIDKQRKVQKVYAKFGKRNMQSLVHFIEKESKGTIEIDGDDFEEAFNKYYSQLPEADITDLLENGMRQLRISDKEEEEKEQELARLVEEQSRREFLATQSGNDFEGSELDKTKDKA